MYLLTKSETLGAGVGVSFTDGTGTANIIDGNRGTVAETSHRSPNLTIDLGERKVVDALWLGGDHLRGYGLKASNNNISYTDIGAVATVGGGRYSFLMFRNTTAYRYWRLSFSERGVSDSNYRVFGVFLMRLLLDLNTADRRPLQYRPSIPRGGGAVYSTYNGNTVQYNAESWEKRRLTFEWQHLSEGAVAGLESLWRGSVHAPVLTVYGRPDVEPGEIYVSKWQPEFGFNFTDAFRGLGKRGQVTFEEI